MKYSIDFFKEYLKNNLSEKRYLHSISVMEEAIVYASFYNSDEYFLEKVKRAALMHDVCKEMSQEEMREYINNNNLNIDIDNEDNMPLLHGIIGADFCVKNYDFTEDMAKAIRWHTTGSSNMSLLDKIVFLADKTGRDNLSGNRKYIRDCAFDNINRAICIYLETNIERLKEKGIKINEKSIEALNSLSKR